MKKVLIIVGIAVVITTIVLLSAQQATRRGTKVYEEEVKTVDSLITTVKASGEIQPRTYVNISSQVQGEIVELRVEEGDTVRRGNVLVQLDPSQYRANVERLEANLRLARINLEKERTALSTYESILNRQTELARSSIVSAESLETAQLQRDRSAHEVRALEEQIRQAEADLTKARDELQKTTLKAPMDGLVTRVNAKLGEQVIVGTMNNFGTVILVLSDMGELLAEVKVDETEVAQVFAGDRAMVTVDALEDHRFDGVVSEIAHTATKERDVSRFIVKVSLSEAGAGEDPAQREIPAPVRSKSRGGLTSLRPGMSAHAAIEVARKDHAVVVPIQAVITKKRGDVEEALSGETPGSETSGALAAEEPPSPSPGGNPPVRDEEVEVVFIDREGKAELVTVTTGLSDEFNVEILSGPVQPGDRVVIGPYRTLKKLEHGEAIVPAEKDEDLKDAN